MVQKRIRKKGSKVMSKLMPALVALLISVFFLETYALGRCSEECNEGFRSRNSSFFGRVFYKVNRANVVVLGVLVWKTRYLKGFFSNALHERFGVIYKL